MTGSPTYSGLWKNGRPLNLQKQQYGWIPNNPAQYFIRLARAYLPDGDLQESLTLLETTRTLNPQLSGMVAATQSIVYGLQSRDQEARTAYEVFAKSRLAPPRNLEDIMAYYPFSDLKVSDRIAEAFAEGRGSG